MNTKAIEALRRCKAAVEDTSKPPSARLELVRDIAVPVIVENDDWMAPMSAQRQDPAWLRPHPSPPAGCPPWKCTGQETSKVTETIRDSADRWVADCVAGHGALIAAAPALLAVCQDLIRAVRASGSEPAAHDDGSPEYAVWAKCLAAVAQATGE